MSRIKGFVARVGAILRPTSANRRMEEEFAFHVDKEAERLQAEGVPADRARQQALASFGGLERYRQEMREGRRANWLVDLRDDLRFGARMLVKQKGLTTIAVLSLAVGIGANTAIFSLANSILFRARPLAAPEQLIEIYSGDRGAPYQTSSYPSYVDFRERNTVLSGLAAFGFGWQLKIATSDDITLAWGEVVSGNYFDVIGVRMQKGRAFTPDEDSVPGRNPVVVIGHGLWQRHFNGDDDVVGKAIVINNQPLTVIGVAPPEYNGMMSGWSSELWVPAMALPLIDPRDGANRLSHRGSKWVTMVGRLKPGATIAQARSQFELLTNALREEHRNEWTRRREGQPDENIVVAVLSEHQTRIHPGMRLPAIAMTALVIVVVNLVLAIACMNLASLLLARAVTRRNEIAVRLAMGAGRWRIIRQLLTENVLLSLVSGGAGLLLGYWALTALIASIPELPAGIRLAVGVTFDWRVVMWTFGIATLTGVLFGLAPAIHSSRLSLSSVLKDDALAFGGRSRPSRSRRVLIMTQVAFSLLLLASAGLMLRSLDNLKPVNLGFSSSNVLVTPVMLDENRFNEETSHRFFRELTDGVTALPGVRTVSLVDGMPGGFLSRTRRSTQIEGYVPQPGEDMEIDASIVGPSYFTNMNVPVLSGRDFDLRDVGGAPCVAIVNDVFARQYLGGSEAAVGRRLSRYNLETRQREMCSIVGLVRDDGWQTLQKSPRPFFYLPLLQSDVRTVMALVTTTDQPAALALPVRDVIRRLDSTVPTADIQTLDQYFRVSVFPFRLVGLLLGLCGVMALVLATIGIYGTLAYSVAQRSREVGIRMALGAERADILRVVIGQGMRVVVYGLAAGLVLSVLLTRFLAELPLPLLFGVDALDIATLIVVTAVLAGVALMACYIPARRAARVDPGLTLRGN